MKTDENNPSNQSELAANACSRRQARENACKQVSIGFSFKNYYSKKHTTLLVGKLARNLLAN